MLDINYCVKMRTAVKMINRTTACFSILVIYCVLVSAAISCDSCGNECTTACGTRHFRTCCFNYLRKRSLPPAKSTQPLPPPSPPLMPHELNLDMWLAKQTDYRQHHRSPLSDLQTLYLQRSSENDFDYEPMKEGPSLNKQKSLAFDLNRRIADQLRAQQEEDLGSHDEEQKTSEESEPVGSPRLQLLYDA
ncbi:uncharacterized protein LOC129722618 [Wyeomyia smithii]|uniref:uncharacterized protein LOC129722618 n=1 Tax=Wyeomyia smithii TaxID=174621 RepID=UPI002467F96F|nr:uncharacterized protein LOC129722618 [Wyeomyia smithii]